MTGLNTTEEMIEALSTWLRTFPQLDGIASNLEGLDWMRQHEVTLAILKCVQEMKNDNSCTDTGNMSAEAVWCEISALLGLTGSAKVAVDDESSATAITSQILCQAVVPSDKEISEEESERRHKMREVYISRILGLDEQHQRVLMQIIECNGNHDYSENELNDAEYNASTAPLPPSFQPELSGSFDSHDRAEIHFNQNFSKIRYSLSPTSPRKKIKVLSQKERELESKLEALEATNAQLFSEREAALESERLAHEELDKAKAKGIKECLHLETELLERENELRTTYEMDIESLRKELSRSEEQRTISEHASSEVAALKDEIDILKHSSTRLDNTEEQLRKCKTKLAEFQDIKEQLSREESARERSVQQVIELEKELTSLLPLRRQLDTYKARATTAEVKLAEVSDELERFQNEAVCLSSRNQELEQLSEFQISEKDDLQRKLVEGSESKDSDAALVGLGEGMR